MAVPAALLAQLVQPAVPTDSFFDVFAEACGTQPQIVAQDLNTIPKQLLATEVRDTVEFDDHPAPRPPQVRTHADCRPLQPICGFLTAGNFDPTPVTGAVFDLLINGLSILVAPVPGSALAPGVPFPLPINPVALATVYPPGSKIDYVWSQGLAPSIDVSADMEWCKHPA